MKGVIAQQSYVASTYVVRSVCLVSILDYDPVIVKRVMLAFPEESWLGAFRGLSWKCRLTLLTSSAIFCDIRRHTLSRRPT